MNTKMNTDNPVFLLKTCMVKRSLRNILPLILLVLLVCIPLALIPRLAHAEGNPLVEVRLVIEQVTALDCFDEVVDIIITICEGDPDFYAKVSLGEEHFPETKEFDNQVDISPDWQFTKTASFDDREMAIAIRIRDDDAGPLNDDDEADLVAGGDRKLDVIVNFEACLAGNQSAITGDVIGHCAISLVSEGNGSDNARIRFRIEVGFVESPTGAITVDKTATPNEISFESAQGRDTPVTFQIVMTSPDGLSSVTLVDSIPEGMMFIEGSLSDGANYRNEKVFFNGDIFPDRPTIITYQAKFEDTVQKGSLLESDVTVSSKGQLYEASASVAIQEEDFYGILNLIYASGDTATTGSILGSGDLSDEMLALINKAELTSDNPNVITLMLLDGPDDGDVYVFRLNQDDDKSCPNYQDQECDGRYILGRNLWHWKGENIASPYTLAEFVTGAIRAYPRSTKILLSLVGHGGGWSPEVLGGQPSKWGGQPSKWGGQPGDNERQAIGGILWDNHPNSSLSTASLADALSWSKDATGRTIDLLFLDACLMAMAEVAYELREEAHYVLASESWSWTTFSYDAHIRSLDSAITTEEIGRAWLHNEVQVLREPNGYPFTYSLIKSGEVEKVMAQMDVVASMLEDKIRNDPGAARQMIDNAFAKTDCFDSDQNSVLEHSEVLGWDDNYCDLASFAKAISQEAQVAEPALHAAAQTLVSIVQRAVEETDYEKGFPWLYTDSGFSEQLWEWGELGGLSIYLPLKQDDWKRRYYADLFLESTKSGRWDDFLSTYWGQLTPAQPDPECAGDGCSLPPEPMPQATIDAVINAGRQKITIAWALQGIIENLARYSIYRQVDGEEFSELAALSSSTHQYFDASVGTESEDQYCYRVIAIDGNGNHAAESNTSCVNIGELALAVPNVSASEGAENIQVPLKLIHGDGLCIRALDITLQYDPNVVEPTEQIASTAYTDGHNFLVSLSRAGEIKISAANSTCQPLYGDGTLFQMGFNIVGNNGDLSQLTFVNGLEHTAIYHENDLNTPTSIQVKNGSITVGDRYITGDINGDETINAADASLALHFDTFGLTPTAQQADACNINGDSSCDVGDGILILCRAAFRDWLRCLNQNDPNHAKSINAARHSPIRLAIGDIDGQVDQVQSIPLALYDANEFSGGTFALSYDPEKITIVSANVHTDVKGFLSESNIITPGLLRVSLSSQSSIGRNANILTLNVLSKGSNATIDLGEVKLFDKLGRNLVTSALQRTIEIASYTQPTTTFSHRVLLPFVGMDQNSVELE